MGLAAGFVPAAHGAGIFRCWIDALRKLVVVEPPPPKPPPTSKWKWERPTAVEETKPVETSWFPPLWKREPEWDRKVTQPGKNGEFTGAGKLKSRQKSQLETFEEYAAEGKWSDLRRDHFDWWMFPIDEPSSREREWTVFAEDIAELKSDPEFMTRYRRGQELLARSWGWDLKNARPISPREKGQHWDRWPVRLYKAAKSAKLFGCDDYFESWKKFARGPIESGENFTYAGFDLAWLFEPPQVEP